MSKINQMAHLVLANPTITVKELAKKMGFAEQKSIYYWLKKAGFRGMKDFRKALLAKCFRLPDACGETPAIKDSDNFCIPLYTGDENLRRLDCVRFVKSHLGPNAFATLITKDKFDSTARLGDILVIDPDMPYIQGDLLLVSLEETLSLTRMYMNDQAPIYIDLENPNQLLFPSSVIGKVVFIIRHNV